MSNYLIQVTSVGTKQLAKVLRQIGDDQREGPSYEVMGSAFGPDEADAIHDAVNEAFFEREESVSMLSAANENVLMAICTCSEKRLYASSTNINQWTNPRLSFAETKVILHLLCCDGYVLKRDDGFYGDSYVLTDRGRSETERVAVVLEERAQKSDA